MTKSLSTSNVVCSKSKQNERKCKKACESSSSSTCCSEQCINCCTSQYQRLSMFENIVANAQLHQALSFVVNYNGTTASAVFNRSGAAIAPPNTGAGTSPGVTGAYAGETGCTAAGAGFPTSLVAPTTGVLNGWAPGTDMLIAAAAYYFVNEFAAGPYEPGCHNNQVYGWFVNVSTGELQLYSQYDGVPVNATRMCLSGDITLNMTSSQRRWLKVLNKLYKLSKAAIKEVNGIPNQEGNIVEVCDCKGERWLLYIDTASSQNGSPLSVSNYEFSIIACKLC